MAIHGTLTTAQKKDLHSKIAKYYEEKEDISTLYSVIAKHYKIAGEHALAVGYFDKAGDYGNLTSLLIG